VNDDQNDGHADVLGLRLDFARRPQSMTRRLQFKVAAFVVIHVNETFV